MFRKVTIALLATAALGMLAPDVVSARGGGGGGHGGFGGFHGGSAASAASTAVVSTEVAALVETVFTPAALVEAFAARRLAGAHSGPVGRASGR